MIKTTDTCAALSSIAWPELRRTLGRISFLRVLILIEIYYGFFNFCRWSCAPICQPLLQQGLSDSEEFVAVKAIECMIALTQLGLLPKASLLGLLHDTSSFLIHPNRWIRHVFIVKLQPIHYLLNDVVFSTGRRRVCLLCCAPLERRRRSVPPCRHS